MEAWFAFFHNNHPRTDAVDYAPFDSFYCCCVFTAFTLIHSHA